MVLQYERKECRLVAAAEKIVLGYGKRRMCMAWSPWEEGRRSTAAAAAAPEKNTEVGWIEWEDSKAPLEYIEHP
jgi:hypothetical protein